MKQQPFFCAFVIACILCCITATSATATPVSFHEEFLGGDQYYTLGEKDKAEFSFDLTKQGGTSTLLDYSYYDRQYTSMASILPTNDEKDFAIEYTILEATLKFVFSVRKPFSNERVMIKTDISDGSKVLHQAEYDLSFCGNSSVTLELDLDALDILNYLQRDGQFITFAIAPGKIDFNYNTFYIESASLSGTYEPVPEPASIFLFGAGLTFAGTVLRKAKPKTTV